MKVYEAIFNEDTSKGVYGISLVENPAMEDEWITLSEHPKEIKFAAVDDSKKLLLGGVLIPNKRIYRNIDGNEFEMKFSEKTIEKLAHNFQKESYQNNSRLEHKAELSDVTFVETWTVENPKNDKSNAFGKTYPKGTWVAMAKVSDENYEKAKKGEIKGFSIDALLQLTEVKFKNELKMSVETKSIKEAIEEGFKNLLVELNLIKPKENEENSLKAIKEVKLKIESEKEALEVKFSKEIQSKEKEIEDIKVQLSEALSPNQELKQEVLSLSETIEHKDKEIEDLKVELAKVPEAPPIAPAGEVEIAFENMTNYQKMLHNRENLY